MRGWPPSPQTEDRTATRCTPEFVTERYIIAIGRGERQTADSPSDTAEDRP